MNISFVYGMTDIEKVLNPLLRTKMKYFNVRKIKVVLKWV